MNASPYATLMRVPMRTMSRQTRYALEGVDDILVYKVAMTTRCRGVTRREGLLLHGHAGIEGCPHLKFGFQGGEPGGLSPPETRSG